MKPNTLQAFKDATIRYMKTPAGISDILYVMNLPEGRPRAAIALCVGRATGIEDGEKIGLITRSIEQEKFARFAGSVRA